MGRRLRNAGYLIEPYGGDQISVHFIERYHLRGSGWRAPALLVIENLIPYDRTAKQVRAQTLPLKGLVPVVLSDLSSTSEDKLGVRHFVNTCVFSVSGHECN